MTLLAPNRRQAINWTNDDPVHWRIYAALWGDELRVMSMWVTLSISGGVATDVTFSNQFVGARPCLVYGYHDIAAPGAILSGFLVLISFVFGQIRSQAQNPYNPSYLRGATNECANDNRLFLCVSLCEKGYVEIMWNLRGVGVDCGYILLTLNVL